MLGLSGPRIASMDGADTMQSVLVEHLQPEFEPVAVVWSDAIPDGAVEYKVRRAASLQLRHGHAVARALPSSLRHPPQVRALQTSEQDATG